MTQNENQPINTRPLGYLEKLMVGRYLSKVYYNFWVASIYNQPLSLDIVVPALRKTLVDNPLLLAKVDPVGKESLKVIQHDLHIDDIIVYRNDIKELDDTVIAELDRYNFDLDNDKLHFKIFIINDSKGVVFITDHILFDGVSGGKFHEIFFSNLIHVSPAKVADIILSKSDLDRDFELPRPTEHLIGLELDSDIIVPAPKKFVEGSCNEKWPSFENSIRDYNAIYHKVNIPAQDLKVVLKKIKVLGVSLTSYIGLSYLMYVVKPILEAQGNEDQFLEYNIAMNMRRKMVDGIEDNVNFAGLFYPGDSLLYQLSLLKSLEPGSKRFWDILQKKHAIFAEHVNGASLQSQYNTLKNFKVEDFVSFYQGKVGKPRAEGFKISNLGLLKFANNNEELKVIDLVFNQSISSISGDFLINVISHEIGGLNMCCSVHEGIYEDEAFQGLLGQFRDGMIRDVESL